MKITLLTSMTGLFLLSCIKVIHAQTEPQAERIIIVLNAKECATATTLTESVKNIDYMDKYGASLLIYGSREGCLDVIKILLDIRTLLTDFTKR